MTDRDVTGNALTRAARAELGSYLERTRLSRPADAVQQFQITMLEQWTDHLAAVLEAEDIPPGTAMRIIRGVIWGGAPDRGEEVIRVQVTDELRRLHETAGMPPW